MKFNFSHSKILENLGNAGREAEHALHLDEAAKRLEEAGCKVLEVTRFNVAVEAAEHVVHDIFHFEEKMVKGFVGAIRHKVDQFDDFINHVEVCHDDDNHHGY
jgi:predicted sulfurtransferase